jgi:hypothetical protein
MAFGVQPTGIWLLARQEVPHFSLKVAARSTWGRSAASLKTRGSERGLFRAKLPRSERGTVSASWPQQRRLLCGTLGQRSATPRLSLPATKDAGKCLEPGPVARPVVVLDDVVRDERGIVVGHLLQVVADAGPRDEGVVERVAEDRRAEEAEDGVPDAARGAVQGAVAGGADEDELLEELRAAHGGRHDEGRGERARDQVDARPDLLVDEISTWEATSSGP